MESYPSSSAATVASLLARDPFPSPGSGHPAHSVSHPAGLATAEPQRNHTYRTNYVSSSALETNANHAISESEDNEMFFDTRSTAASSVTPMFTADSSFATVVSAAGSSNAAGHHPYDHSTTSAATFESLDTNWPSLNSHCYATAEEEDISGDFDDDNGAYDG